MARNLKILITSILLAALGTAILFIFTKPAGINFPSRFNKVRPVSGPESLTWSAVSLQAAWSRRDAHSAVVFKDRIWLFAGLEGKKEEGKEIMYESFPHKNDVWSSYDGQNWDLVLEKAPWTERRSAPAVVFKDKIWLFGGWEQKRYGQYKNDIWNTEDGQNWTAAARIAAWSAREGHAVTVFKDKIWLAGGVDFYANETKNDVWYSEDGVNWVEATKNAAWSSRYDHTLTVFKDKLWVIGGLDFGNDIKRDVWSSDDGVNWQLVSDNPGWIGRHGHAVEVFRDKIWIISGWHDNGISDVWYSEDGKTWKEPKADPPWPGREDHAAVVFNDKMWLLGGMAEGWSWKNDIWSATF